MSKLWDLYYRFLDEESGQLSFDFESKEKWIGPMLFPGDDPEKIIKEFYNSLPNLKLEAYIKGEHIER